MSLVEILIGLVILSFALIPVVTMTRSTARTSSFTEMHAFWQTRIARMEAALTQWDYPFLLSRRRPDGTLPIQFAEPAIPAEYARLLKHWEEEARFEEIEPGIGRLTVTIAWSFPLDRDAAARQHRMRASRLICDPALSWKLHDLLPAKGGS